jgi:CRP-like cAMP-binding protein
MAENDLRSVALPTLKEAQIVKFGRCAKASLKQYRDGETLSRCGERDFKFLVVQCGEVEILDESGETPKTVTVYRSGEFTGDVAHLTGSSAVVSAIARGDCEVYEVSAEALRQVLNGCPDLAAVFLAGRTRKVLLLVRGDDLYKSMSSYLARRIEETANIGNGFLSSVEIVNNKTGAERTVETPALFSFIGAVPWTDWLPKEIETDSCGFVRTGPALTQKPPRTALRPPFLLVLRNRSIFTHSTRKTL